MFAMSSSADFNPDTTALSTQLIHHPYQPPSGFASLQPAVQKASTVFFPSMAAVRNRDWAFKTTYTYGLHGTPTSFVLEERLATLEGARHCLLAPSGLAAIANVNLALLGQGDHVLVPDNVYGPNQSLLRGDLARYGIAHGVYDPLDVDDLVRKITPQTRLVWLEAAGSVSMEFPDLPALVRLCRQHGVAVALDNTWGAGLAFAPFDLEDAGGEHPLGVDVSVHALTKYPSGGGDVLMGSISTRDDTLHKRIKACHMRLGLGVGMNDVESVLRSLPSMELRYRAQDRTARHLAQFLARQPQVAKVLHPALPDAPGHAHWQQLCGARYGGEGACAGIFSFVPQPGYTQTQIDAFCEHLQHFRIGYSWGGSTSLVMAYDLAGDRSLPQSLQRLGGHRLVRLCIGLEDAQTLERDLAQALASTF